MSGERLVKHSISNAFDKNGKDSVSLCFRDVFHMIKRVYVIFGKQKHLEKRKKLEEKLMHGTRLITIGYMQSER